MCVLLTIALVPSHAHPYATHVHRQVDVCQHKLWWQSFLPVELCKHWMSMYTDKHTYTHTHTHTLTHSHTNTHKHTVRGCMYWRGDKYIILLWVRPQIQSLIPKYLIGHGITQPACFGQHVMLAVSTIQHVVWQVVLWQPHTNLDLIRNWQDSYISIWHQCNSC